ncbi:uncharacterized protein EAF01_005603 [Botrytis porri]|uniref:Uncharacterized protein n=1 Tax=Botrytis porri TaxID=87229 RepID=A0A4Z1KMQ4_9HELO|nr:uncharacterized protein EAF01_005603 [Botrytis porri]KAF7905082.1 hypothetical protein EAF01_005603 [Botrytis porri]TGO87291.1 hypothetical protein BPOR_0236g00140 [Botrytis porri]
MLDSTSNRKENTPLELVSKRIRRDSHQEATPPFKKHKRSEWPTSTEPSAGYSTRSISDSALEDQDLITLSRVDTPPRKDGVDARTSPSKVITFTSPLETGPSSQIHARISEIKSILATKENTPASPLSLQSSSDVSPPSLSGPSDDMLPPPSPRPKNLRLPPPSPRPENLTLPPLPPRPSSDISSPPSPGPSDDMLPPPSPRPKNLTLPVLPPRPSNTIPPPPRPTNAMFPPLPPRPSNTMPPPPRPTNSKVSRGNNTGKDQERMSSSASTSPSSSQTLNPKPVKLRLKLINSKKLINGKSRKRNIGKCLADDEAIDVTHDIHVSKESDSDEKVDREEGLAEETGTLKFSTSTVSPQTSPPMTRSSQINRGTMLESSKAKSVYSEVIKMLRQSKKSLRPKNDGIPFPNPPEPPYATTYRGLDLKAQIEAHKCELCIPYGWKIPNPRLENPPIPGPLYRKVLHLRRDCDKTITTAIEFTDVLGEDNVHAFLDRAENDAYNAGMPKNLEPRILAVRWDNGAQMGSQVYRSIYSFYRDPYVFVVGHSLGWRLVIEKMRGMFLSKQNWIIWWTEKDYDEDWNTDLSR